MKKILIIIIAILAIGMVSGATIRIESNTNCHIRIDNDSFIGPLLIAEFWLIDGIHDTWVNYTEQGNVPGIAGNTYYITGSYSVIGVGNIIINEVVDVDSVDDVFIFVFNDPLKTHSGQ